MIKVMSDKMIDISSPDSLLLNAINAKAAQACQVARVSVESPSDQNKILCNYYGITFMGSGSGKDRVLTQLDRVFFWKVEEFYKEQCLVYMDEAYKKLDDHVASLETKTAKANYRLYNEPRMLTYESSDGTPEGLVSDREAYQMANFGGTFFKNGEFVNYLKPKDKSRESFLSLVGEIFDHGNNTGKTIKSNKRAVSVFNVPSSMLVHSTPSDIHKHGVFDAVCENLNRQFARRAFICYPDDSEKKPKLKTAEEMVAFYDNANEVGRDVILHLQNHISNTIKDLFSKREQFVIRLTKEARIRYFQYQIDCQSTAESMGEEKEGLKIEMASRPWKMLKLAGIINTFATHSNQSLDVDVLEMAIYQTEFFGAYYRKFYSHREADDVQLVYDYFERHLNEPLKVTLIRDTIAPVSKNRFTQWWRDNLPMVEELALDNGCEITEGKGQKNSKLYVMKKILGGV